MMVRERFYVGCLLENDRMVATVSKDFLCGKSPICDTKGLVCDQVESIQ